MSGPLLARLERHADERPLAPALSTLSGTTLAYRALWRRTASLAAHLCALGGPVGLLADDGLPWALVDLAALRAGVPLVPLPAFFHDDQLRHVIATAGLAAVLTDDAVRARGLLPGARAHGWHEELACVRAAGTRPLPGVAKVTFTSGTTGRPKGVCLGGDDLQRVAVSLQAVVGMVPGERHVTSLPLAVLLENVGGLYLPLLAGAEVVLASAAERGIHDACGIDASRMLDVLASTASATAILVPQMLDELVAALEREPGRAPPPLRFVGVGGAPIGLERLARAWDAGLPAFEGYGISEAGSVVALDGPRDACPGSAGRPLPHVAVRVAPDGEILVRTARPPRYLGGEPAPAADADGFWHTGDLGALDARGHLFVRGRRGDDVITSWGRNVSTSWVAAELLAEPAIAHARVHGNGESTPRAELVPTPGREHELADAVARVNARLPAYARVAWEHEATADDDEPSAHGPRDAGARDEGAGRPDPCGDEPGRAPDPPIPPGTPRIDLRPPAPPRGARPFPRRETPMAFFETLRDATQPRQDALMRIPFVQAATAGTLTREEYLAFLAQAYHHVRETVPLFMAAGARLAPRQRWLQAPIAEYLAEEIGHDAWILSDIEAAGGDPDAVREGEPGHACDVLVAYAWDTVLRRDPVGLFGMVHVLEGTSVRGASRAARALQERLGLPTEAFTYLTSHGALDVDHVAFFAGLMDRLDDPRDQRAVLRCARATFTLYGDVFGALPCGGASRDPAPGTVS